MRNGVAHVRIKAERSRTTGDQLGTGNGVPAGKERHIVTEPDKSFRQVGSDPLSPAVESRRNALNKRSDLCDFHDDLHSPGACKRIERTEVPFDPRRLAVVKPRDSTRNDSP